jgi:TonB family protein
LLLKPSTLLIATMRRPCLFLFLLLIAVASGCASPPPQTVEIGGNTAIVGSRAARVLFAERVNAALAAQTPGADASPQLLKSIEPAMPREAILQEIEGEVVAELSVEADGRVSTVRILTSSHELLSNSVVDAMLQWTFSPLIRNGVATRFVARQTYVFKLASP